MTLLTSPVAFLLLRTTLLLGLALLAVRLLRRRGPTVQTLAGRAALAAVALLLLTAPLTRFVPPLWHVPAPIPADPRPTAPTPVVTLTPTALPPLDTSDIDSKKGAGPAPVALPVPDPPFREDPAKQGGRSKTPPLLGAGGPLLLLWAAGTALLLLWLAVCQTHLTRLHRRAVPLTDGYAYDTLAALTPHPPRLYTCPGIDGPFLAGLVRPAIHLPTDHAETFSPDALRAVLAHELAHAGRHDTCWTLASRLLCALLWPQPLLWLVCRKLDHLSEDACDLAVLAHACPPRVYADCLLTLAERRPHRRTSPLTAGLVPFRSQLARRVQHILTVKGNPPMLVVTKRLRLAIAATTFIVAFGGTLLIAAPKEVRPPALSEVHAAGVVGIWTGIRDGRPSPNAKYAETVIFGPQGELAIVGEAGTQSEYGRYTLDGPSLIVTLNRTQNSGRTTIEPTKPQTVTPTYSITNGILTVHPKDGSAATERRRVSNYPAGIAIEVVAAQQAALLGAKPPVSARLAAGGLVGIWSGKAKPNMSYDDTIVFGPEGDIALYEEGGAIREYGRYALTGSILAVTLSRDVDSGQEVITAGESLSLTYSLSNGVLTLHPQSGPITTVRRVGDYPRQTDPAKFSLLPFDALLPTPVQTSLTEAQLLAGLTPVQGSGVIVMLQDKEGVYPKNMSTTMAPANVVHADDLAAIINELKAAGAEAITVNDQRLVTTSSFNASGTALLINGTPILDPFVIEAIGNSKTLAALRQPNGVADYPNQGSPSQLSVQESNALTLPAYSRTGKPQYAHAAP